MSGKEDGNSKDSDGRNTIKVVDRPTIILKTREGENRALSPSQRNGNKKEPDCHNTTVTTTKHAENKPSTNLPTLELTNSIQFMDENMQICENVLDFLLDQQDFLVVGCLGLQGVGKSTILSKLASNYGVFPVQTTENQEHGLNCTNGINLYVTKNRVIYLDTQPILSTAAAENASCFDVKKPANDFGNTETNLELQSLQFAAFMFSVCHVIVVVQDWFVDPNLIRFFQAAEMLKPSSTASMDQDYVEHYPHLLFLHNKADTQDFLPDNIAFMKDFYTRVFSSSKLRTHSGLSMNHNSSPNELNLFLIPDFTEEDEFTFHEKEEQLINKLRIKIHGIARYSLTPSTMTERNWFHYASKVNDAIRKSHLSSEYSRLTP